MAQPQPADMGSGRTTSGTRSLLDEYRVDPNSTGDLFPEQKANSAKRKIALALVLLAFGSICIIAGVNVFFHNENGGIPLLVVGSFAFIPGSYYSWIAYNAWRGRQGYDINQIPDV